MKTEIKKSCCTFAMAAALAVMGCGLGEDDVAKLVSNPPTDARGEVASLVTSPPTDATGNTTDDGAPNGARRADCVDTSQPPKRERTAGNCREYVFTDCTGHDVIIRDHCEAR